MIQHQQTPSNNSKKLLMSITPKTQTNKDCATERIIPENVKASKLSRITSVRDCPIITAVDNDIKSRKSLLLSIICIELSTQTNIFKMRTINIKPFLLILLSFPIRVGIYGFYFPSLTCHFAIWIITKPNCIGKC